MTLRPRSWGAVADVVGHCVLVFAFVPPLAELPRWLAFEASNPLNGQDPIVLAFLPMRGLILLLGAFSAGLTQGMLGGVFAGLLLSVLLSRQGGTATLGRRLGLGALGGALAASLAVGTLLAPRLADLAAHAGQVGFEIVLGMVCGVLAAPTASRLLSDPRHAQGRGTMVSASQ